ncbi:hypothetical protein PG301_23230 [Parageobacillus sp. G301]|nr:hypothetical protein PG301_23230 [Parageobacillus sp. G301]
MKSLAILSYILVFVTILWFLYIGNYLSLSTKDKTKINIPFFILMVTSVFWISYYFFFG